MAPETELQELVKGLVGSVLTNVDNGSSLVKRSAGKALSRLRDRTHPRTNQFEVQGRLSGLVEKFGVLNRDDLAVALQSLLDQVQNESTWTPEILSLLLDLSDRPVEKTDLEAIEGLACADDEPVSITWEDIVTDDPLNEEDVWDDLERGYHSSGDELTVDGDDSERTDDTDGTSVDGDDLVALAKLHLVTADHDALDDLSAAQDRLDYKQKLEDIHTVSELTMIRETLSMLHGVPTAIFTMDSATGRINTNCDFILSTSTKDTAQDILAQCADICTQLNYLRMWIDMGSNRAHVQSMQASTRRLLMDFSTELASIETRHIQPQHDQVVSIAGVLAEVRELSRPLVQISHIVRRASSDRSSPWALLDTLFDEACIAHMVADDRGFQAMGLLLCDSVRTYLQPLQLWIEHGQLPQRNPDEFLIQEANSHCELGKVWHERWAFRLNENGSTCAPDFILPFVPQIFAMGKTRAFLRILDYRDDFESDILKSEISLLQTSSLMAKAHRNRMLPFSDVFQDMLNEWISGLVTDLSSTMWMRSFKNKEVRRMLDALDYVYFSKDGANFEVFAESLFEHRHQHPRTWRDSFLLTELAQSTVGTASPVDDECLSIRVEDHDKEIARSAIRDMLDLRLNYSLPWPIQNITSCASPAIHSESFLLLLQICYAKHVLRPGLFDLGSSKFTASSMPTELQNIVQLRQRLICFADCLHSHHTYTAARIHGEMRQNMDRAKGIDEMAAAWAIYEHNLATNLLLRKSLAPIKHAVLEILEICEHVEELWSHGFDYQVDGPDLVTQCSHLSSSFEKSLSFITAGLKGVSRVGGESDLGLLAERLQWCSE